MELTNFYSLMPQKNCGICGYSKCTTFARHVLFADEDMRHCAWLDQPLLYQEVKPVKTRVNQSAFLNPCITDGEKVMAELYLAAREVDYGYLDPQFCEYVNLYFTAKCSQSLGIARIEYENKEILLSQTGKVVVRQAESEEDALETVDLVHRVVSGAVICSSLSTVLESISGPYSCDEWKLKAPSAQERELLPIVTKYETSALKALTMGQAHEVDVNPLKSKAVTLVARNQGGLVLYALVGHMSCMQEAVTDAARYRGRLPQNITDFVHNTCVDSHSPEEYHQVLTRLTELTTAPFYREVFKVIFHDLCMSRIRNRFSL